MKTTDALDRISLFREIMPEGFNGYVTELQDMNFFLAPASTKFHGNYPGGLFDHSLNVTNALVNLTNKLGLEWERPESPYIIGMFHDICKCDQYKCIGMNNREEIYEYRKDTLLKGHGDKSVMLLSRFYKLTEEEIMCIRYHMGAFCEKEEWSDYTRAIHYYPNVLYTHTADMIAAHILEVD